MTRESLPGWGREVRVKDSPTPVVISEHDGLYKWGELYAARGMVVTISTDDKKFGMRRSSDEVCKTLIKTKTSEGSNSYLIKRGVMLDLGQSVSRKLLIITDLWGSSLRQTGITLTVGEEGRLITQTLGEVESVLVQTGGWARSDSDAKFVKDDIDLFEKVISEEVPDYRNWLDAAI